jgi:TetR/AcrR family transcriptional repressor of nem operon
LALLERYIERDNQIIADIFERAKELHDDPLHQLLIGLKLFAELMADLPKGHPGCLVATFCYQERLSDNRIKETNRQAIMNWRLRFREAIGEITEIYPPRENVDLDALADMVSNTVEGGIILSKALHDPSILPQQVMLMRNYFKLLFITKSS